MTHLTLLTIFCLAQIAVGVAIGRRVRSTSDFFVAGRRLGPAMLFSTMVAANIGAGSTVGAAGYGYRDGLAAWWWVGSAAIGSIVLALWVGPRIRRLAETHDLQTLGDFLEWRYDWRVRAAATSLLWIGTLVILAGQLLALSFVLEAVAGWPRWIGCLIGGVVMTIYFTAGGMLSTIWVNLVQLVVLLVGFGLAMPYAFGAVGGWEGLRQATDSTGSYWSLWRGGGSGWIFLAMLGPSFFLSPGLLQKVYGARDDRAVRIGVLANAAVLFAFAFLPVLLGMIARALHPGLDDRELALPMLLVHDLPLTIGSLGPGGAGRRRDQHRRRHPVHAVDVAVARSLPALPAAGGDGRRRAARRADHVGRGRRRRRRHRDPRDQGRRRRARLLLHAAQRQPVRADRRRPVLARPRRPPGAGARCSSACSSRRRPSSPSARRCRPR